MKLLISILLALTSQVSIAAATGEAHQEGAKSHKDWNQVFKQPEANKSLSETPEKTQLLEPAFLSQIKGSEVTLKWKAVEGVKYHLQVATDSNFKWIITNEQLVDYTEYTVKNLENNKQYFWRVYTQKPENMSAYTKSSGVSSAFETIQ